MTHLSISMCMAVNTIQILTQFEVRMVITIIEYSQLFKWRRQVSHVFSSREIANEQRKEFVMLGNEDY